MVMYSIDYERRVYTLVFLGTIVGATLALLLRSAVSIVASMGSLAASIVAAGSITVFLLVFWLNDKLLWKLPLIRLLNFNIPNLAGVWEGSLSRKVGATDETLEASLEIKQRWSAIDLVLTTKDAGGHVVAVSRPTFVALQLLDPTHVMVSWVYVKDGMGPRSMADSGTGIIELGLTKAPGKSTLRGTFFSAEPQDLMEVKLME
jgi:hypothetical protein